MTDTKKPYEETWTRDHAIVTVDGEPGEYACGYGGLAPMTAHECARLQLAAAAPDLYRALVQYVRSPTSIESQIMANDALRKARGGA